MHPTRLIKFCILISWTGLTKGDNEKESAKDVNKSTLANNNQTVSKIENNKNAKDFNLGKILKFKSPRWLPSNQKDYFFKWDIYDLTCQILTHTCQTHLLRYTCLENTIFKDSTFKQAEKRLTSSLKSLQINFYCQDNNLLKQKIFEIIEPNLERRDLGDSTDILDLETIPLPLFYKPNFGKYGSRNSFDQDIEFLDEDSSSGSKLKIKSVKFKANSKPPSHIKILR